MRIEETHEELANKHGKSRLSPELLPGRPKIFTRDFVTNEQKTRRNCNFRQALARKHGAKAVSDYYRSVIPMRDCPLA